LKNGIITVYTLTGLMISLTESDFYDAEHLNKKGAEKLYLKINVVIEDVFKKTNC
jgi:hypothetical protein